MEQMMEEMEGKDSRWRDCHFADSPSPSIFETPTKGRGGCSRLTVSCRRLGEDVAEALAEAGVELTDADEVSEVSMWAGDVDCPPP